MPYCSRCGVEVDNYVEKCPLCGTPIQKLDQNIELPKSNYPEDIKITNNSKLERVNKFLLYWMINTILTFTPFFVILTISLQLKTLKTWGGYPLVSLLATWLIVTAILLLKKWPIIMTSIIMIIIGFLLYFIDLLNGKITWFFKLGLPLLLIFTFLTICVIYIISKIKNKGLNIAAIILLASGIFCIALDFLIVLYNNKPLILSWSLIIVSAFVPLALFLFFLHFILYKKIDLKRFFHI